MRLIVGLGNPGGRYEGTRHNAGRAAVESLAARLGGKFKSQAALQATTVSLQWEGGTVVLAYPECFMNVSGEPVRRLVSHFEIHPGSGLLVVVDDIALPFGRLRLRPQGSSGGHNGLKSIEQSLGSMEWARLRMGAGPADVETSGAVPLEDYVLSRFSSEEEKGFEAFLARTAEACRLWFSLPIERAMNVVNASTEKS